MTRFACILLVLAATTLGSFPAYAQLRLEDQNFSLDLGGRVQPGYQFDLESKEDRHFFFGQNRLSLGLEAWGMFEAEFTLDFNSNGGYPEVKDLYASYVGLDWMSVQMGQFKVPASKQRLVSGSSSLFIERSPLSSDFVPGRDLGLALSLHTPLQHYALKLGAFTGQGENMRKDDEEGFPLFSARLEAMPFAPLSKGEGDVEYSDAFSMMVGAYGTYSRDAAAEPDLQRIDGERWLYGGDLSMKFRGLFVSAEFAGAYYQPSLGESYYGAGFIAQASYFIAPIYLEPALRFDQLNPNDLLEDDLQRSVSFGLNAYPLQSHALKFMLNYTLGLEGQNDLVAFMMQLAYP